MQRKVAAGILSQVRKGSARPQPLSDSILRRGLILRRRLFTLFSAASLLLCVAACALWITGCFTTRSNGLYGTYGDGPDRLGFDFSYRHIAIERGAGFPGVWFVEV